MRDIVILFQFLFRVFNLPFTFFVLGDVLCAFAGVVGDGTNGEVSDCSDFIQEDSSSNISCCKFIERTVYG